MCHCMKVSRDDRRQDKARQFAEEAPDMLVIVGTGDQRQSKKGEPDVR